MFSIFVSKKMETRATVENDKIYYDIIKNIKNHTPLSSFQFEYIKNTRIFLR
jgi:hypothetical protein